MVPLRVLVVPLFIEMKLLNLQDTYMAMIAPSIASAFGVFLIRQAIQSVPADLDEARPSTGPAIADLRHDHRAARAASAGHGRAVLVHGELESFLWPLVVIRSPEFMTLPLGLATLQGQFTTEWNVVMAGSVFSVVPIVIVYLMAQRYIIAGIAHTGLK